jgi:hypothetical protein
VRTTVSFGTVLFVPVALIACTGGGSGGVESLLWSWKGRSPKLLPSETDDALRFSLHRRLNHHQYLIDGVPPGQSLGR